MVESKQASCGIIAILKDSGDNKQLLGQMNWLEVSTTVGRIRNVGGRGLDMQSQGETSCARRAGLVCP